MKGKGKIWPLVVVHLDANSPNAKSIFDIKSIGGLLVKVETKRKSSKIPQCRRCQRFFHTANYCRAPFICAFCSDGHITAECKSKDVKGNPRPAQIATAIIEPPMGLSKSPQK